MKEYTKTPIDEARGLIDSEYEALAGMTKDDLWDYLHSSGIKLSRDESDGLHIEFGLGKGLW